MLEDAAAAIRGGAFNLYGGKVFWTELQPQALVAFQVQGSYNASVGRARPLAEAARACEACRQAATGLPVAGPSRSRRLFRVRVSGSGSICGFCSFCCLGCLWGKSGGFRVEGVEDFLRLVIVFFFFFEGGSLRNLRFESLGSAGQPLQSRGSLGFRV